MLAEEKKDIEKNVAKEDVPDEPPCPYWLMMIPYFLTFVFFHVLLPEVHRYEARSVAVPCGG